LRVVWSPLAFGRAIEQAKFIALDKPGAAEDWLNELFSLTDALADLPDIGRIVPELRRADFRELSHGKYRLIYRIDEDQVSILTVRSSRRLFDPSEISD